MNASEQAVAADRKAWIVWSAFRFDHAANRCHYCGCPQSLSLRATLGSQQPFTKPSVIFAIKFPSDHFHLAGHPFAVCSRVTDGSLMRSVRPFSFGKRTHSLVMTSESKHIRFVDSIHIEGGPDTVIRF